MSVSLEELKKNNSGNNYEKGYRIVYFYDNYYKVGEYCKTIDGFMIGFAKCDSIIDDVLYLCRSHLPFSGLQFLV